MDGTENYYDANMTGPLVLVIGSEGRGVSRLTKKCLRFHRQNPNAWQK